MNRKGFTLIELVVVIAIIGVLAAILVPTMMNYTRKAKLKAANHNAKVVFNTVNAAVADLESDGKKAEVKSCTSVIDCTSEPDASKKLEHTVYEALSQNGEGAGYAYWIAGEDGRYKLAQWCNNSSPTSGSIIGQYPDPAETIDDLPDNFTWGTKF